MSNPEVMWPKPFAWNATNKNTIQEERQPSQDEQDATVKEGLPLVTMTPQDVGGIAPNGQDFNGIFYAISSNMVHRQKGLRIQFDPAYAAKIGGYEQGCILASNDYTRDYISLIPNNLTNPNGSGTAGRWAVYAGAGSIASATASIAGIVKIVDNLSSTATDAALTANQGKVLGDRTQQATITNVGISRFANAIEIANKSNDNVSINPRGVADMFIGASLGTEGYLNMPNGTMFKWGKTPNIDAPVSGTVVNVTFQAVHGGEFPNACINLQLTTDATGGSNPNAFSSVLSKSKSAFSAALYEYTGTSQKAGISWFAIGN